MHQQVSFDDLPEEIWIKVIQAYITVEKSKLHYLSVDLLLPLTLVSTTWRRRIINTPIFWTSIMLDDSIEDMEVKLVACLFFSKQALLTLNIPVARTAWKTSPKTIAAHSSRIGAIQIIGGPHHYPQKCIHDTMIKEIMPLPALRSFSGESPWDCTIDIHPLIESSPILTRVSGYSLNKDDIAHLPSDWKIITTCEQPEVVLPLLAGLPSLRDVSLLQSFPQSDFNIQSQDTTFKYTDLNWTFLIYHSGKPTDPPSFLPSLKATLTWFEIRGQMPVILNTVPFLSDLYQLRTLVVRTWMSTTFQRAIPSSTCSVTRLEIHCGDLHLVSLEQYEYLASIFPAVTPLVRIMAIYSDDCHDNFEFIRGQTLDHLISLELCPSYRVSNNLEYISCKEPLHLPSALLELKTSVTDEAFSRIFSESTECLTVTYARPSTVDPRYLHQWPVLRKVTLRYTDISFSGFDLPQLHELTLHGPPDSTSVDNISGFCAHLALYPSSCPYLENLSLYGNPEWDILVLMLERRNIIRPSGTSPINRLELPAFCSREIRCILIELIQGRVPDRPSNFELSLGGNVHVFCDPLMYAHFSTSSFSLMSL
jgi:hypothetical protein